MKKYQFLITLSQRLKFILLTMVIQLILLSHVHAEGIRFSQIAYLENYGFLGIGDNGLAAHSADGMNWKKITLPSIGTDINLVKIIPINDKTKKGFTILTVNSSGDYKNYQFETNNTMIKFINQQPLNYPDFVILDEFLSVNPDLTDLVDGGNIYRIFGYNRHEKRLMQLVRKPSGKMLHGEIYDELPQIHHVSNTFPGGAIVDLESPYRGAHSVRITWNRENSSNPPLLRVSPLLTQLSGVVYDGFAGESYMIDVTPDANGTIKAYKETTSGQPALYKTAHTGSALSESGVVALVTTNGGLVAAAADASAAGVEVVDFTTGKSNHVGIAARTCAYREDSKTLVNGKPTGNITIFLGKDNYALVSTNNGQSWYKMPIVGL